MGNQSIPPLELGQGLGTDRIERAKVPPVLALRPYPNINTHPKGVIEISCPSLLTQGICPLSPHSLRLKPCAEPLQWELAVWNRAYCMTAGKLGRDPVPTQQAGDAQGHTTHLVSSPLMQGWLLTPLCPFIGCSVPASTIHVEVLVTDAVQASTSSRGSPPPRTVPTSASVRIPH